MSERIWGQIRSGPVQRVRHFTSQTSLNGISQKRKQLIRWGHGRGHLQQERVRSLQPRRHSNVEKNDLTQDFMRFFSPVEQSRLLYPHDRSDSRLIVKTIMFIRYNYHFLWQFSVSRCRFQLSNMKLLWIIIHHGTFLLLAVMPLSAFAIKKKKNRDQKNVDRKNPPGYTHLLSAQGWSGGQKSEDIPSKCWLQPSLQLAAGRLSLSNTR